ncbi:glycosyltransferase 87 family protein, partial [Burkholderia sola]
IFWAAARVAIEHGAAAIFSPGWMQPIEAALRPFDDFAPWPYPPTFLLVILPFGLVPFAFALVVFATLQIACYAAVVARVVRPLDAQLRVAIAAFPGLLGAALTM